MLFLIFLPWIRGQGQPAIATVCANAAGQALTAPAGSVESAHPYGSYQNCYYQINTVCSPVRVRFTKFDVEDEDPADNYIKTDNQHHCEWDSVQIKWISNG